LQADAVDKTPTLSDNLNLDILFPEEYCIGIWKQQDQEVDQEIDGWMK